MSSYPAQYAHPHYNDNTDTLDQQEARLRARLIYEMAKTIPADQRGNTPWTGVKLDDLPSSNQLESGEYDSETIFQDALTASSYHDALLPNKQPPDSTIPTDPEILRAHVKVLFKAFKSVPEDVEESEDENSKESRKKKEEEDKTKRPFILQNHDNHLVESLCWKILETCIYRSKKDQNLVEAWEPGKLKGKKTNFTFAERFDKIVQTMAESKSICKHLFDVDYMYKIVDDPVTAIKRVIANKRLNGKKAELMKRGKEASEEDGKISKRPKTEDDNKQGVVNDGQVKTRPRALAISAGTGKFGRSQPRLDISYSQPLSMNPTGFAPTLQSFPRTGPFTSSGNYHDSAPSASRSDYPNMSMPPSYPNIHTRTPPSRGLGISGLDTPRSAPHPTRQLQQSPPSYSSLYSGLPSYLPPQHPMSHTRSVLSSAGSSSSTPSDHTTVQHWPMTTQVDSNLTHYYQEHPTNTMSDDTTTYANPTTNTQQAWHHPVSSTSHNPDSIWSQYHEGGNSHSSEIHGGNSSFPRQSREANDSEYAESTNDQEDPTDE